ncbi:MAG: DPP IV N-terminal domain-containing protein, partial [Bacteroidota bacterium]
MQKCSWIFLSLWWMGMLLPQGVQAQGAVVTAARSSEVELTIPHIMRDPLWMGSSPQQAYWNPAGKDVIFLWNPDQKDADSLYHWAFGMEAPEKMEPAARNMRVPARATFSQDRRHALFIRNGNLFWADLRKNTQRQLTATNQRISNPQFLQAENLISFRSGNNLYTLNLESGLIEQLTDFQPGSASKEGKGQKNDQEGWVNQEELRLIEVLGERKAKRERSRKANRKAREGQGPVPYFLKNKRVENLVLSPDGRYVTFRLRKDAQSKRTEVPTYIVEEGYADMLSARPKVGSKQATYEFGIMDLERDSSYLVSTTRIPGIKRLPEFMREYMVASRSENETLEGEKERPVIVHGPKWSTDGAHAVVVVRSQDFKDRWIMALDAATGNLRLLDHQRDEAWVGGPGIQRWLFTPGDFGWLPDNENIWFISEESGYAHLTTVNLETGKKKSLTDGEFEVFNPKISQDGKSWYFTASKTHPGERHFYRMPIKGGKMEQLTSLPGSNLAQLSPDEKHLLIRHSTANQPWDLYIQPNEAGATAQQITQSTTEEFAAYNWRTPEFVSFEAKDGQDVYARLYRPKSPQRQGPAVIFVHGAGYLQNAHKWWSSYFREYMFHNFLVDRGYTVLDIDYRGSAGYGRDWRTGIYRHMGGLDLSDHVDGANF